MSRASSTFRDRMIFVVGARRSGTNWLQRVIASHPSATAVPSETYLFSHGLAPLVERFHHGSVTSSMTGSVHVDREVLLDAVRDLSDAVFAELADALDPKADILVERTPDHVRHLRFIAEVYPDARFVHIIRDGRDVVRSLLSQTWGPSEAREAALEWRTAVETARTDAQTIPRYTEVRYEDLLREPRAQIEKLFDSLGFAVSSDSLTDATNEALSTYNVDPNAPHIELDKWRELGADTLAIIEEVAGDLLARLGYQPSSALPPRTPRPVPPAPRRRWFGRGGEEPSSFRTRAEVGLGTMDRFITAAGENPAAIAEMMAKNALIRIATPERRLEVRGERGIALLVEELTSTDVLKGRQTMGYVHPSVPAVMFVGTFDVGGQRHPIAVALTVEGDRVTRAAYYRFTPSTT